MVLGVSRGGNTQFASHKMRWPSRRRDCARGVLKQILRNRADRGTPLLVTGPGVCKSKTGVFEKSHEEGKNGRYVNKSAGSLSRIAAADGGGLVCMSGPMAGTA